MTTKSKKAPKAAPVLHIQGGGVRIPIWKNEGEDGPYYKAGIPELSYKGSDGQWRTAKSYGARDLVNLIKIAALAHTEILQRNRAEKAASEADRNGDAPDSGE